MVDLQPFLDALSMHAFLAISTKLEHIHFIYEMLEKEAKTKNMTVDQFVADLVKDTIEKHPCMHAHGVYSKL